MNDYNIVIQKGCYFFMHKLRNYPKMTGLPSITRSPFSDHSHKATNN